MPPCPAHARWWQTRASGLVLRWELQLGAYSGVFFFLPLPVMLPSEIPKLPTDPPVRGFPAVWKLLLLHDSLPRTGLIPNSLVTPCLLYFALPPLEENGLPFWVLVSSASVQKLFCTSCLAFKWYFDEFMGERVVSASYSSAILGLPPLVNFYSFLKSQIKRYFSL